MTTGNASQAQSITFGLSGSARLSDGPFTVAATSSSALPVTLTSETPATCTVAGFTITPLAIAQCSITATQAGNGTYQAALPVTRSIDIIPNLFGQFIAPNGLPAEITVSVGSVTVSYAGTSGLPVTLTTPSLGYCRITGYTIYLLAPGICSITATVPGDNTWASSTRTDTLPIRDAIALQTQALTFAQLPDRVLGTGPFFLTAASTSLLTPSFLTTTPDICSVTSGGVLTPQKIGQCSVTAFQNGRPISYSGETLYAAAPPITRTFNIAAGGSATAQPQTIMFAALNDRTLSQSAGSLIATATSGLPVSFTSETPSVCTVALSSLTLLSTGTCIVTASQSGDLVWAPALSVSRSFNITSPIQAQTLTFNLASSATRSTNSIPLSATITPGPGTIAFSSSTNEICGASSTSLALYKSGTCSVTATASPTTPGAFQSISITRLVTITGSSQSITFAELPDRAVNSGSFAVTATASSNLPVTFLATGACKVSGTAVSFIGLGSCTITATQQGDTNWDPAPQVARSFQITSSALQSQTITFGQPSDRLLSAGTFAVVATASSGLPVTLTSSTPAVCIVQGLSVQPISIGICMIAASQPGNASYAPAIAVSRSFALVAGSTSSPAITAVVNAASYAAGPIAPSSYVAIFGRNFGTSPSITIRDAAGTVSTPSPVYSGDTQINFIWPASAVGSATLTVQSTGLSDTLTVSVVNTVPALFSANSSGQGPAAANVIIVNNDKSVTTRLVADGPIPVLSGTEIYLVLYGTGIRGHSPGGVTAKVAGRAVEVLYAGAQGAYPGLDQINLRIPLAVGGFGSVVIELTVDGSLSNEVTATFQ